MRVDYLLVAVIAFVVAFILAWFVEVTGFIFLMVVFWYIICVYFLNHATKGWRNGR